LLLKIDKLLIFLGNNFRIIGICSAISIIGFIITILIFINTKNINRRVKEYKTKKNYNKKRIELKTTLVQFREAIEKDDADIKKIKGGILDELNVLKVNFHSEFDFIQNLYINSLITHLEKKDKHNTNCICNKLSRIASYLVEKKEETI